MQKEASALLVLFVLLIVSASTVSVSALVVRYLTGDEEIDSVTTSSDGSYTVASTGWGKHLYMFDKEGNLIWKKNFTSNTGDVAISSDGNIIALVLGSNLCLLGKSGEALWTKVFESSTLWHVAISGNGESIGTIVENHDTGKASIQMFDQQGLELWTYDIGEEGVLASISISSTGELTAFCRFDDYIYLLDNDGNLNRKFQANAGSSISDISMSSDGKYIAAYSNGLCLFDTNGQTVWKGDSETWGSRIPSISAEGDILAAYNSPDLVAYNKTGYQLWNYWIEESIEDVTISCDGTHVIAGTRSGIIYILDNPPGEEIVEKPSVKPSKISCSTTGSSLIGTNLSIAGRIEPAHLYTNVILTVKSPSDKTLTATTLTSENGTFEHTIIPNELGNWHVNASWPGDADHLEAQGSTSFSVELVEDKGWSTEKLNEGGSISMKVGEKYRFTTYASGSGMWYDYRIVTRPEFISYQGSYTEVLGGKDYISSTISVLPYAKVGTYQLLVQYGWSGTPMGGVTYDYDLPFTVNVSPSTEKYNTSVNITDVSQGLMTVDVNGDVWIDLNGYHLGFPDAELAVTFIKPDGSRLAQTSRSDKNGNFHSSLMSFETGSWSVTVEWNGDSVRNGYKSPNYSFGVSSLPIVMFISVPIVIVALILTVLIILRRKRKAKTEKGNALLTTTGT